MINTNSTRLPFHNSTFGDRTPLHDQSFSGIQDTFSPSTSEQWMSLPDPRKYPRPYRPDNIIGLADPSKYPGYTGDDLLGKDTQPNFVPDYNKYPRDKPGICGGWDAPMYHNGRTMTRREYAQLFGG